MNDWRDGGLGSWIDIWVTQLDYKLHSRIHGIYVSLLFINLWHFAFRKCSLNICSPFFSCFQKCCSLEWLLTAILSCEHPGESGVCVSSVGTMTSLDMSSLDCIPSA